MGFIIGLAIIGVVLWLIWLFIVHIVVPIILPVIAFVFVGAVVLAALYGLVVSIKSFWSALIENKNPYDYYVDKKASQVSGVRRNYFFGPSYSQVLTTSQVAFTNQTSQREIVEHFKTDHWAAYRSYDELYVRVWVATKNAVIWTAYAVAIICITVFGFLWIGLFSVTLAAVIGVGMVGFFVFFSGLWSADRLTLLIKSIQSRCGNCKRTSVIPSFTCPNCGEHHQKLTPGPYGTLKRKCTCGEKLPTTIFTGRSQLKSTCPFCTTELAASDAEQFGIQIIGGVSSGKTSFMAAFWHHYENTIKTKGISYERHPEEAFEELDVWFNQGISDSTTETNANMYSIVHKKDKGSYQLTLYDIAGEAFSNLSADIQQQQFKYCEGLVFIVDLSANPTETNDVFSNFIRSFKELKGIHANKSSKIPVSVIISKADKYKKDIGLIKIKKSYENHPTLYTNSEGASSLEMARSVICRKFLESKDFDSITNLIDGEFSNVAYFPVSAMGHEAEMGEAYESWGVEEPVKFILNQGGYTL